MNVLKKDKEMAEKLQICINDCLNKAVEAIRQGDFIKYDFFISESRRARNELLDLYTKKQKRDRLEALVYDLKSRGVHIDFAKRFISEGSLDYEASIAL